MNYVDLGQFLHWSTAETIYILDASTVEAYMVQVHKLPRAYPKEQTTVPDINT